MLDSSTGRILEPPSQPSSNPEDWRFKDTGGTCEWAEEYCPGGFHPVALGDTFHDGKYREIRKLGDGSYSTVWLAVSTSLPRYVALKIMIAKAPSSHTELSILAKLSSAAHSEPDSRHITVLLDEFQLHGPNGRHQCLVFEPMGATAASLVEELPENKPNMYGRRVRYPKWMAKKMLIQALRGLAFLHRHGVVHGDVQPENILFPISGLDSVQEEELRQNEAATAVPLKRVDGKLDRRAPASLYLQQSLDDCVQVNSQLMVKLSDLGSAFWETDPPESTVTPVALRAPELVLRKKFGAGIDIWSFGCLMFEFLTGRTLFALMMLGHDQQEQDDTDDDHLVQLNDVLRPRPESMMNLWPRASKWFGPNRQLLQPYSNDEPHIHESIDTLFAANKSSGVTGEERILVPLMRRILEFDPAQRLSAEELLQHSWFSD